MPAPKRVRIGDLLVEHKIISEAQLQAALADQKKSGRKLGRVLIENGFVKEDMLLELLSRQLAIPFIDLTSFELNPEQVQIFTPLPSTYSALMYCTGIDPFTGKELFVERDTARKEKQKLIVTDKSTATVATYKTDAPAKTTKATKPNKRTKPNKKTKSKAKLGPAVNRHTRISPKENAPRSKPKRKKWSRQQKIN